MAYCYWIGVAHKSAASFFATLLCPHPRSGVAYGPLEKVVGADSDGRKIASHFGESDWVPRGEGGVPWFIDSMRKAGVSCGDDGGIALNSPE